MNEHFPTKGSIPLEKLNEMIRELRERSRVMNERDREQTAQRLSLYQKNDEVIRTALLLSDKTVRSNGSE